MNFFNFKQRKQQGMDEDLELALALSKSEFEQQQATTEKQKHPIEQQDYTLEYVDPSKFEQQQIPIEFQNIPEEDPENYTSMVIQSINESQNNSNNQNNGIGIQTNIHNPYYDNSMTPYTSYGIEVNNTPPIEQWQNWEDGIEEIPREGIERCVNDEHFFLVSYAQSIQKEEELKREGKVDSYSMGMLSKFFLGENEGSMREHKKRLRKRINKLGFMERSIPSDGNCQFGSIADQIFGTCQAHKIVRKMVVTQLVENPQIYAKFVSGNYNLYCMKMAELTYWGDNISLQAASDVYGVRINLITSIKETVLVQITPMQLKSSKTLWLSFLSQQHFNSLYTPSDYAERKNVADASSCALM